MECRRPGLFVPLRALALVIYIFIIYLGPKILTKKYSKMFPGKNAFLEGAKILNTGQEYAKNPGVFLL